MPEMTITGFEARISSYAAEHHIPLSRSKAQRLALRLSKRQTLEDEEYLTLMFRHITYQDPTGDEAARNIDGGGRDGLV